MKRIFTLMAIAMLFTLQSIAQTATDTIGEIPELIFRNPELVEGNAGQQGAVYRFNNVAPGIDAKVLLKYISDSRIYIADIDLASMGWDKAFQPQFGIAGDVPSNIDWHIDFRLTFFEAGTETIRSVDRFTATSLDVDGDGVSIKEYVTMYKASSIAYSPVSYLVSPPSQDPICGICGIASAPKICADCNGTGKLGGNKNTKKKCLTCQGVGQLFSSCNHVFDGSNIVVQGPTENFFNIDTSATQVMASYIYDNKTSVDFTIGAASGDVVSNAGMRLNSLWFKGFNLAPVSTLPIKLQSFKAVANKSNISLLWATTQEENFSHFVIERSINGKSFTAIATIFSAEGSTSSLTNYAYKDATANDANVTYFYRIRSVDKTGDASLSSVCSAHLPKEARIILALTAYPNPTTDQVKITLPKTWLEKTITIELFNASGTLVQSIKSNDAHQIITLELGNLPKGFYMVKAVCNNEAAQDKIFKN